MPDEEGRVWPGGVREEGYKTPEAPFNMGIGWQTARNKLSGPCRKCRRARDLARRRGLPYDARAVSA